MPSPGAPAAGDAAGVEGARGERKGGQGAKMNYRDGHDKCNQCWADNRSKPRGGDGLGCTG
jgi:hypothetical protein